MSRKLPFIVLLLYAVFCASAQGKKDRVTIGFNYGFGNEFKNRNYTFTNHFYKANCIIKLKKRNTFNMKF